LKKYILAHPFALSITVFLGIVTQGIATSISFFVMFIIDSIATGEISRLFISAYIGIGVIVFFYIALFLYSRMVAYFSYKTVLQLKKDVFFSILETKISDFNRSNSANYISLINNDIKMVSDNYINSILALTKDITTMIFALTAMALLSPVNAIIALVLSSAPLIIPFIFGKRLSQTNMLYMNTMAKLNEKVKDFLLGFEVIKTFGIEKNVEAKFSQSAISAEKSRYNASKVNVQVGSFSGTILVATQIITYLVAGYFVITGSITIGAVIAIAGLSASIIQPIQLVSLNISKIKSTKEIRDGLEDMMTVKNSQERDGIIDFSDGIKVENLSYKYERIDEKPIVNPKKPKMHIIPNDGRSIEETLKSVGIDSNDANLVQHQGELPLTESGEIDTALLLASHGFDNFDISKAKVMQIGNIPVNNDNAGSLDGAVLKNISYDFKRGGKYAIVGESGSGKTTLIKILMGYYDDYIGHVFVDNVEIRDINRESLYKSISMIHQNVFILDDTLRNNITLENPYSDEEYRSVIDKAHLNDVYQSVESLANVGESGNTLSGGEKQRIAIARALIKGAKAIILDEAMANLDNETAYNIEKTLINTSDLTCIFVTHRYTKEVLQQCDGIIALRDGEICESGSFDELYEKKGYFYSLYNISGR
jgi:ABC-type multidrug transport system fused ATPase/permease subunit